MHKHRRSSLAALGTLTAFATFTFGLLLPAALVGCATAVDEGFIASGSGDSSPGHDARTIDAGSDTSIGSDTARPDTSPAGTDTREGVDTRTDPDTATEEDTAVEPDTEPPPTDTTVGPGGPCDWCLEGSCDTPDEDLGCFYGCVIGGHLDCRYDKSMSPVCLCTD